MPQSDFTAFRALPVPPSANYSAEWSSRVSGADRSGRLVYFFKVWFEAGQTAIIATSRLSHPIQEVQI